MHRIASVVLVIGLMVGLDLGVGAAPPSPGHDGASQDVSDVSLPLRDTPTVQTSRESGVAPAVAHPGVYGASIDQREAIAWAIARYAEAGLELPGMVVVVHGSSDGCDGNRGLHRYVDGLDIVDLCDTAVPVILHELAHVWTSHSTSDSVRASFLLHEGLDRWSGTEVPYDERGTERASQTLSICLAARPLSPEEAAHYGKYLDGYEILTGSRSPRMGHVTGD